MLCKYCINLALESTQTTMVVVPGHRDFGEKAQS